MNGEKVDLRLKWHCGNLNLVPCEPMLQPQAATSVICLLSSAQSSAVVLVICLNYWIKPLPVQCSCPSDMFELLDQAPPSLVQLSKTSANSLAIYIV